jgi:2'-5' RNA ligase
MGNENDQIINELQALIKLVVIGKVPGLDGLAKLTQLFEDMIKGIGSLEHVKNRSKMGNIIFKTQEAMSDLEENFRKLVSSRQLKHMHAKHFKEHWTQVRKRFKALLALIKLSSQKQLHMKGASNEKVLRTLWS